MNTTVINIRTTKIVKKAAMSVAEDLGFSLSSMINAFLKQLIKTKTVTFSAVQEQPTEYLLQTLKESNEDKKKGYVSPVFDNVHDAIGWLDNPKKKYANKVREKIR